MPSYSVLICLHEGRMFFRTAGKILPGQTTSHTTDIIIIIIVVVVVSCEYPKSYRFITYRLPKTNMFRQFSLLSQGKEEYIWMNRADDVSNLLCRGLNDIPDTTVLFPMQNS
jgi:hypothetical protein